MDCCIRNWTDDYILSPDDEYSVFRRYSSPVTVEADYVSDICPIDQILGSQAADQNNGGLPVATLSPKRPSNRNAMLLDETVTLTPIASAWKKIATDSEVKSFRKGIYNSACKMALDFKEELMDIADNVANGTVAIAVEINDMMNQNLMDKKMMIAEQNSNKPSKEMVQILDALSAKYDYDLCKVLQKSKKIVTEQVVLTVSQENLLYLTVILGMLLLCFCKILLAFRMIDSFQTTSAPTPDLELHEKDESGLVNLMFASFAGAKYDQGKIQVIQPFLNKQTISKLVGGVRNFAVENFLVTQEDMEYAIKYL